MGIGVRRSDVEIIREILSTNGAGITHLRYSANLSHKQLKRYLVFLERSGIIVLERQGSQIAGFTTTDKGRAALNLLEDLISVLGYRLLPEV